jgi:hypothetical protein
VPLAQVNGESVYQEDPDEQYYNPDKPPAIPTGGFYLYLVYHKPDGASAAVWRVKYGGLDPYEIELPVACWNADPEDLQLRLYSNSNDGAGHSVSWPECYDGTSWNVVGQKQIDTYGGSGTEQDPPTLMTDGNWDTYNVWREVGPYSSRWQTNFTKVAPRWYEDAIIWNVAPTYSCVGFGPPMNGGAVTVKKNRALPFKAELVDNVGDPIRGADLDVPPVIQIVYQPEIGEAQDVSDDAVPVGLGTEGNQFEFAEDHWQYNLKTKAFTAAGTYTVTMEPGDGYVISPSCVGEFVIE